MNFLKILLKYKQQYLEASKPKWVNPILNIIGVNPLRLGGLHLNYGINELMLILLIKIVIYVGNNIMIRPQTYIDLTDFKLIIKLSNWLFK